MGAKNHAIVMPDASADATMNALVAAGFGAAGQRCMALSTVVFVGGSKSWYYVFFFHMFSFIKVYYAFHIRVSFSLKVESFKLTFGVLPKLLTFDVLTFSNQSPLAALAMFYVLKGFSKKS